jgi:hypothetical protein
MEEFAAVHVVTGSRRLGSGNDPGDTGLCKVRTGIADLIITGE